MSELPFMAVILGGDMNCYAVARAFYEEYKIKSLLIGKAPIFPTANSKLLERRYDAKIMNDEVLIQHLRQVEQEYPGKKKFLFGCNDDYVRHIIHNRAAIEAIGENYIVPMVSEEVFDRLDDKDTFYQVCEEYGLPYPRSVYFDFRKDAIDGFEIPFDFPIFIKPVSNVTYDPFQFPGKQKGYKIESRQQLEETVAMIEKAAYPGSFVFQEYIEGGDDSMYIYAAYANSRGKVVAMTGSQTLMHDRTPELIGNYDAMTDAMDETLCEKLRTFLEKVDFTGICNFDVQYDQKRGDYVIYEINIRQGRSNYFMMASGLNYAKLLVEDYIEGKDTPYFVANRPFIVSLVSRSNLKKAVGATKVERVPREQFYRFTLAPYDRNWKNEMKQRQNDRQIMANYWKYGH